MSGALSALTLAAAVGSCLVGGALFAFSSFVMPALRALPPAQGLAAMQAINVKAVTPAFMLAFMGTALLTAACAVAGVLALDEDHGPWLVAGAALYLVGVLGLTAGYHVPRNDALAKLDPTAPEAAAAWRRYDRDWTRLNHLRALAGAAACAALIMAL